MNKPKAIIISLSLAFLAFLFAYSYMTDIKEYYLGAITPISVVVAVKDIPEGTRLDESHVGINDIPRSAVQPGACVGDISEIIGRLVLIPVLKGTQILETMYLLPKNEGISSKIPPDMRAVSIPAKEVSCASGLIQPGEYVDIAVNVQTAKKSQQQMPVGMGGGVIESIVSIVPLQNVQVLSINRISSRLDLLKNLNFGNVPGIGTLMSGKGNRQKNYEAVSTITLCLNLQDALKVVQAQAIGTVYAILRSRWDKGEVVPINSLFPHQWGVPRGPIVPPVIE